jgi:rhodanese-related sulfurtransferase
MKFFSLCLLFSFLLHNSGKSQNIYKKLSVIQCDSLIHANQNNPNFVILDVRTESSWKQDHLYGSIFRNYYDSDFEQQLDELPKHKLYLIHCQAGSRSAKAFTKMQDLNFAEVYELRGGISAWKNAGLPTTSTIEPKLMLVDLQKKSDNNFSNIDTIRITITNRANDTLKFSSLQLDDIHELSTSFDEEVKILGAHDYSFYIFHSSEYADNEITEIQMASNGGLLKFNIEMENGVIQNAQEINIPDVAIYPNPANQFFNIKNTGKDLSSTSISIYNIAGQQIYYLSNFDGQRINVSNFKDGLHFISIHSKDKTSVIKLIVKH